MRIYIFKSQKNDTLRAFSGDPGGQELPKQFAPWHAIGVVRPDKDPPYKLDRTRIEEAISNGGFQLFRLKKSANAG